MEYLSFLFIVALFSVVRYIRAFEKESELVNPITSDPIDLVPIQRYMWCINPGHGKLQAGKRSPIWREGAEERQFFEWEFNREVADRIISRLDDLGIAYFDVLPDAERVGQFLEERVDRVNRKESNLPKIYVSIHSNAFETISRRWTDPNGVEVYHYYGSEEGKKIARVFQQKIVEHTGIRDRGVKSDTFFELRKTTMPAVLTENGFFTNIEEVKKLMDPEFRQRIADAHVAAILEIERCERFGYV